MRRGGLDVLVGGWLERHEELPTGRHAGGHYHINVSTRLGVLDPDLAAGSGAGGHDDGEGLGVGEQRGRRVLLQTRLPRPPFTHAFYLSTPGVITR